MPKVVVIAGANGSGKSTIAPKMLRQALAVHEFVNADSIATGLSAFAPDTVAFKAGRLMLDRVRELAKESRDFAFETTLASRTFAPWLKTLQSHGYEFHLIYLWLPQAELAIQRVAERVRSGGHDVPAATVRRRYEKSLSNFFNLYRPFADSWLMLDNSKPSAPQPMAWRNVGGPLQIVRSGLFSTLQVEYERDTLYAD